MKADVKSLLSASKEQIGPIIQGAVWEGNGSDVCRVELSYIDKTNR
jgi:hypothetical protein